MEYFSLLRNKNHGSSFLLMIGFLFLLTCGSSVVAETSKVHIVYLGEKQHDDPELVTWSHHQILVHLLGSNKAARDSMVYSYQHGFSGFAAKLTDSEVRKLADVPEVVHVIPNRFYTLKTTRSWDYLGLNSDSDRNLLNDTREGDGVIIGVLDSGVWPESKIFNEDGLGPIPARWKGSCESGEEFNATDCNKKLIGAKYFVAGMLAILDGATQISDYLSPRDHNGHGTHVSTIAAGSFVFNQSYKGLASGTIRGGAPRARIAMYKVCWELSISEGDYCATADIMKGFDEAIRDGVDVLSLSLGGDLPLYAEVDMRDGIAVGAFHAVTKGIPVVCAASNDGPDAQTVDNTAPWITTVAATTLDRSFPTVLTLGNDVKISGQAFYTGKELGPVSLVYPENPGNSNETFSGDCERLYRNSNTTMLGKVVLCFTRSSFSSLTSAAATVMSNGGLGLIAARNPRDILRSCDEFPCITVDYELGTDILFYIRSTRSPVVKISPSRTLVGKPVATKVAAFSSRGPNSISPAILKPDIAAPGVHILAAWLNRTMLASGTSMATPAIAGVVALLKVLHPRWSPAAIRSAIVTTAWKTDPFGEPIFAEGSPRKLADPFDYGGGLVNPEEAAKPGLIYDMSINDYARYLCSAGYNNTAISRLIGSKTECGSSKPSVLDMNLPSITIPNLNDKVTITRTVTNVGPVDSTYNPVIETPLGIKVVVLPEKLVFTPMKKKFSYKVEVSTQHKVNTGYFFGSLTWTDGKHNVTIPLSVRTQILRRYTDDN